MADDSLARQVRDMIESGSHLDDASFASLCLAIAEAQGLAILEREVTKSGLEAIEPLPEAAFRLMTVAHFAPSEAEAVFLTSGTTSKSQGRHLVRDLDLYRLSALRGFERFAMYPPRPKHFVSLIPEASKRPHSSLSHMVTFILDEYAENGLWVREGDCFKVAEVHASLEGAARAGEPVMILGTTLDFLRFFESLPSFKVALPPGSRVMHTGGFKASGRSLSREALWEMFFRALGVPPDDVIEEYGMTEILSQAYDSPRVTPGPRRFVPVPWMRTRVVDPITLEDVSHGRQGLLCHYDLANVWTSVAILTGDLATRVQDGFTNVERAPGEVERGCSLEAGRGP